MFYCSSIILLLVINCKRKFQSFLLLYKKGATAEHGKASKVRVYEINSINKCIGYYYHMPMAIIYDFDKFSLNFGFKNSAVLFVPA